jgi:hypothetical protein
MTGEGCHNPLYSQPGMTLRDYFAGQTLAADYMGDYEYSERAKAAYKSADAMLAAREGKK